MTENHHDFTYYAQKSTQTMTTKTERTRITSENGDPQYPNQIVVKMDGTQPSRPMQIFKILTAIEILPALLLGAWGIASLLSLKWATLNSMIDFTICNMAAIVTSAAIKISMLKSILYF